jgi:hypothetical protein
MTLRTQYDELPHISPNSGYSFKVLMRTGSNYFLGFIRIQLQYSSSLAFGTRTHFLLFCRITCATLFGTSTAKGTFARFKIRTNAFVIFLLYHQNYLHNLQNSTSGCFPWAHFRHCWHY